MGAQQLERLQRSGPPGRLGTQEQQLVDPPFPHRLEHGKQRAQRFADPRRRLCQQHLAPPGPHEHLLGQLPLPDTHLPERKLQRLQCGPQLRAMRLLLLPPPTKARTQPVKELRQFIRLQPAGVAALLLLEQIEVQQTHIHMRQPVLLTQKMPVHHGLCPVQGLLIFGDALHRPLVRLDLLDQLQRQRKAIRPAAHLHGTQFALHGHFAGKSRRPTRGDQAMAFHALAGRGAGGEAQIQITAAGGEVAQGGDRDLETLGLGNARD